MPGFGGWACWAGEPLANHAALYSWLRGSPLSGCTPTLSAACYCPEDVPEDGFGSGPSQQPNPAPWWDPTSPASAEFYGFYVTRITGLGHSSMKRPQVGWEATLTDTLRRARMAAREVNVEGILVASSCRGASYGIEWLYELLSDDPCRGDCVASDLTLRLCCDQPDEPAGSGLWTIRSAGILDAPSQPVPLEGSGCGCTLMTTDFSIVAADPYLWGIPNELCRWPGTAFPSVCSINLPCMPPDCPPPGPDDCGVAPCGSTDPPPDPAIAIIDVCGECEPVVISGPLCCDVSTTEWRDGAITVEVFAGSREMRALQVSFWPQSQHGTNPQNDPQAFRCDEPCATMYLPKIPAGSRLIVDGVSRRARVECGTYSFPAERFVLSGGDRGLMNYDVLDGGCEPTTVCFSAAFGTVAPDAEFVVTFTERRFAV